MSTEVRVGDVGTELIVTVRDGTDVVDISTATVKQFILVKSDGERLTKDATFVTDGTDGQLQYTTVAGDLSRAGNCRLQVYLSMPSWTGHSSVYTFIVRDNL